MGALAERSGTSVLSDLGGGSGARAVAGLRGDDAAAELFRQPMYMVRVTGWPEDRLTPEKPVAAPPDARLAVWVTDPADGRQVAPPGATGVLFETDRFSLVNSGNRTLRTPKRSWKADLDGERLAGMSTLNLKSMFNDPSQQREALAWRLFGSVGVPASRHTYAKLAIDQRYMGLYSLIEQVDRRFLKSCFGKNDEGNLYKAYCGDLGCSTLEHRVGADGDDGGRQYQSKPGSDDATYRLKTNEDDPAANSYDDLAEFVRRINGVGLPGGDGRFATDAFRASVEAVFNARAFLRWAGANLLIGGWDNYFATPSNYYLYNSGRAGDERGFMSSPYFTFIPWDYDNSFGIDYFGTDWQYTDLLDWPANTRAYRGGRGVSRIPLVTNLLANRDFRAYYLDHVEYLLDTGFSPEAFAALIGDDGDDGLWQRVSQAAYLESATPNGAPFTGRQWTNDEVWRSGCRQKELRHGNAHVYGIVRYVRMRRDRAREQLARLRRDLPAGAGGADFPAALEPLPTRA